MDENAERISLELIAGDEQAFDTVYKQYYRGLCAFASQYVTVPESEEIVQDVMMWLWENRKSLVADMSLKSLLFTIVRNKCLNTISHIQVKQQVHERLYAKFQEQFENPDFYIGELMALASKAIRELPDEYRKAFGYVKHPFTGVDYVEYYKGLIEEEGAEAEIVFANHPEAIVKYTKNVLCCDIHNRERSKRRILAKGGEKVLTLAEILNAPVNGSGYNAEYGLLGSNKATETTIKLFPKNAQEVAEKIQKEIIARTGVKVEAMVYGDGAFKDPVGKIWELADPVVGAGYTDGLNGLPNELKLKYLADNDFADLNGDALADAIKNAIKAKEANLKGQMASEGTTPRRLTDLIGSLCDLTSGSGDKGTPIVLVQNYFNNYAN